jgi:AcrR family transcriptional regulator
MTRAPQQRPVAVRVIDFEQAVSAGCRHFLDYGTIDMDAFALRLSVSRATLYRVVGSRDRLVAEVLWRLAEQAIERGRHRRTQDGVEGVVEVFQFVARTLLSSRGLRTFLAQEPDFALRLLGVSGGVHRRAVISATLLFHEVGLVKPLPDMSLLGFETGTWLSDDPERVAHLFVGIIESLCFAEPVGGAEADRDLAEQAIRGLLAGACAPSRSRKIKRLLDATMCLIWAAIPGVLTDDRIPLALGA